MASNKSFSTDNAVREYLALMHELAIRIELVAHACDGKLNFTPPYAREYAYLPSGFQAAQASYAELGSKLREVSREIDTYHVKLFGMRT